MKVFLIGADGQLGSDLVVTRPSNIELVESTIKDLDVTNRQQLEKRLTAEKPDYVINTSAYVRVDDAEDEVETAFRINAFAVKDLAQICNKLNIKLVHISTDYVFCGIAGHYAEDDAVSPINVYGLSKSAGERFVTVYCPSAYIVRLSSLYGKAGAQGKGGNFVYTMLKKQSAGEEIRVVDDVIMSPTYTVDASRGIWELITAGKHSFGFYHLNNTGWCSWYQFTMMIMELSGLEAEVVPVKSAGFPTKANRPANSSLHSIKNIVQPDWKDGLKRFIDEIN